MIQKFSHAIATIISNTKNMARQKINDRDTGIIAALLLSWRNNGLCGDAWFQLNTLHSLN